MRTRTAVTAGAGALVLAATMLTVPAEAHRLREPDVRASNLCAPATMAVGGRGEVYVTPRCFNTLTKVDRTGAVTDLYELPLTPDEGDLVGVAYDGGATYHVETDFVGEVPTAHVVRTSSTGERAVVSDDLWAHERTHNPDASVTYGFRGLRGSCADALAEVEEQSGVWFGSPYRGRIADDGMDWPHPYQLDVHRGDIYVADGAGNSVLMVDGRTGDISTVAVVPATTTTFTPEMMRYAERNFTRDGDLPDCLLGRAYTAEPLPTDVEVDVAGGVYVSTFGGPVGHAAPLSAVYRIVPRTGTAHEVARGMSGVGGLAVTLTAHVFVAETSVGRVSVIRPFTARAAPLFEVDSPGDVDVEGLTVYATTLTGPGGGGLVTYRYLGW